MSFSRQPWLANPTKECIFILAPAILPVLIILIFQDYFLAHEVNTAWWIILVLCIDVSHVYSTLFRLYWDKQTFKEYKYLLIIIPSIAFVIGFGLHYYNSLIFWRILAYIAVYHFVRQQYGFMRLYSRHESNPYWSLLIDNLSIYSATLYPIWYWHLHATDKLSWFVKGDFVSLDLLTYDTTIFFIYLGIFAVYLLKEIINALAQGTVNIPKNLIVLGTYISWYVGIVAFQGDLIFTVLNVVAHGVPYMALIWIHGEKKTQSSFNFNMKGVGKFILTLLILAYVEENLWDGIIWKEHSDIFPALSNLPSLQNPVLISFVVSILVLPQITHYVLDGFIWRFSKDPQARLE